MQAVKTRAAGDMAQALLAALRRHTHYGLTFQLESYTAVVEALLALMHEWGGSVLLVLPAGVLQNHMWTVAWKVPSERLYTGFQMGVRATPPWASSFYVRVVTQLPTDPSPYGLVVAFHRPDTAALAAALASTPFLWASPHALLPLHLESYTCAVPGTRRWHVEEWGALYDHERGVPQTAGERELRRLQCAAALLPQFKDLPCTKAVMLERIVEQLLRSKPRNVAFVASTDAMVQWVAGRFVRHARPYGPVALHPLPAKCVVEQQRAALLDMRNAGTCVAVAHHAMKNLELLVSVVDVVVLVDPYVTDDLVALLRDCSASIAAMQLRVKFPVSTPAGSTLFASARTQPARRRLCVELLPGGVAFSVLAGCTDRPPLSFGALVDASRRHGRHMQVHQHGRAVGQAVLLHGALLDTLDALVDPAVRSHAPDVQPDDEALAVVLGTVGEGRVHAADPEAVSRALTFWVCKMLLDGAGVHVLFAVDGRMVFRGRGVTYPLGGLTCATLSLPGVGPATCSDKLLLNQFGQCIITPSQ